MRDALSIMDQAIASAPIENGRPVLSAAQIRELMGAVPNAVFERLLEAVAAGQSAELMEQLNLLVNAGHNPSSLARQMVRYLRNALMAKAGRRSRPSCCRSPPTSAPAPPAPPCSSPRKS